MAGVRPISWWQWIPLPWRKWRLVGTVEAGDEVPDRLPRKGVVLVEHAHRPTWAAFDCPCGRGHRLMVNLDQTRRPVWRVASRHPLSIRPSVDDVTPLRRCHFWITNGRITWDRHEPRKGR